MIDKTLIIADDPQEPTGTILKLAYGGTSKSPVATSNNFRVERGFPFMRAGRLVYATPQFRALTLYSPVNTNAQLPKTTTTPTAITYPIKTV